MRIVNRTINSILGVFDYKIVRRRNQFFDPAMEEEFIEIYEKCKRFTEVSVERLYLLYKAVEYVIERKIPGDIVECGVYKGGSSMMMAYTLKKMNVNNRRIYLYDTFAGMTEPKDCDVSFAGLIALNKWKKLQKEKFNQWVYAPLESVKRNLYSTGYPENNLLFVKGKVEDTIPQIVPEVVSILLLDTDWFESTYHELKHLYPRLSPDGVIIIDDYGTWKGSKKATDNYFNEIGTKLFLQRVDPTARIAIKS
ncbi:MAG: class I SAM-dependent methyltransferase [Candidatus Omnitrophica bacterium]|nr:class I SAM-dependent methyltransferase [Candidatus Omnitrophota bacterium]